MKILSLMVWFSLYFVTVQAQHKKYNWKNVDLREFSAQDSIHNAIAEWFEPAEAAQVSELSLKELKSIKKKAAKYRCNVVFVDVKGVYKKRKGELYVLAIRRIE